MKEFIVKISGAMDVSFELKNRNVIKKKFWINDEKI